MIRIEEGASLARLTSLRVGGPARYLARVSSDEEVRAAMKLAFDKQLPFFVLGKGSNILFPDEGFAGVVILMEDRALSVNDTEVTAGAGVFMRSLSNFTLSHSLRGVEELAGIPGTVGGAIRGNAGTWNTEIKDVLKNVEFLDADSATDQVRVLTAAECGFGHRESIFKKHPEWIIVRGVFQLQKGDKEEGEKLVALDMQQRRERQPYDAPSGGSIFKNPPGKFAGALMEQAGMKGVKMGGAEISALHANWVLNRGGATSKDIQQLIKQGQERVLKSSGILLEPEMVLVSPL